MAASESIVHGHVEVYAQRKSETRLESAGRFVDIYCRDPALSLLVAAPAWNTLASSRTQNPSLPEFASLIPFQQTFADLYEWSVGDKRTDFWEDMWKASGLIYDGSFTEV